MGRIKSRAIKKNAKLFLEQHKDELSTDFNKNKEVLKELNLVQSTKVRNKIAGYVVRLLKKREF